jgi:hypothetical protein
MATAHHTVQDFGLKAPGRGEQDFRVSGNTIEVLPQPGGPSNSTALTPTFLAAASPRVPFTTDAKAPGLFSGSITVSSTSCLT